MTDTDEGFVENGEVKEDIDERRIHRKTYDYLCRLLEVRNWLAECLKDDSIPPVTSLENNFRNGVLLARLGHSFAPEIVTERAIFDRDQEKYRNNDETPVYRHTDNIMLWRRSMESVRLPEIFIPETADVYEGRNMKTIFCLYALATLLYRLRKAPPLRNLSGKAQFTNEEMEDMKEQLKDTNLPEFGDVGGLLSDRMTSDEKALKIAIEAIHNVIRNKDKEGLLKALQNADAGILYVESNLTDSYLDRLSAQLENDSELGQKTIQSIVVETNNFAAISDLKAALSEETIDPDTLLLVLHRLQFENLKESAVPLYVKMLKNKTALGLTREQIAETIQVANALADVKIAVIHGSSKDTFQAISNPVLELEPNEQSSRLYYNRLSYVFEKSSEDYFLTRTELQNIIYDIDELSPDHRKLLEARQAVETKNEETLLESLFELCPQFVVTENLPYYMNVLSRNFPERKESLYDVIEKTNIDVHQAFTQCDSLVRLNTAARKRDASGVRLHLLALTSSNGSNVVRTELVHWYVDRLIEEVEERTERQLKDSPDQNGESAKTEEWLEYRFSEGSVWVECEEHRRSTRIASPQHPVYLQWEEVETVLSKVNEDFENYYKINEEKIIKSQAATRGFLERKRAKRHRKEEKQMDEAATTIQKNYKNFKHRKDAEQLKTSEQPSLNLVRKFAEQLDDKDNDGNEQIAIEERKTAVFELRLANYKLDSNLSELDEKIGLLIKNRINLKEVVDHKDKIADESDKYKFRPPSMKRKARESHETLEQLLFHLQTEPGYMANLIEASEERKELPDFELVEDLLSPLFGFISDKREQFLLMRLMCELLLRDVEKVEDIHGLKKTKNFAVIEAVLNSNMFCVLQRSQEPATILADELKAFLVAERSVSTFNLDPLSIYQSIYGKDATDVTEAVNNENVLQVLENSKTFLAHWAELFTKKLLAAKHLPASMQYLSTFLYDVLKRQLQSVSLVDIQRTVSEFTYEMHVRRGLWSARSLFRGCGQEISDTALAKLHAVLQFIQYAVGNKGYGNQKWFLSSLNREIHIIYESFKDFTVSQISVPLDSIYEMNEFTHFDPARKPILSVQEKQVVKIIKYLKLNAPVMMSGTASPIHSLLTNLKDVAEPSDRTMLLSLHPSACSPCQNTEVHQLFIRTKKYLVDLLLSGLVGVDVDALLEAKATPTIEKKHQEQYNQENMENVAAKQKAIREGLSALESSGKVTSSDHYQALVTDIANDIRLATRRRKERSEQKLSLDQTEKTLLVQRDELKMRLMKYEEYLDTCLENLTRTSRRLSFRPDTKEAGKVQKERRSLDVIRSYKNSAEKMFRKGILADVGITEYQSPKRMTKVQFEIGSTDKKGLFRFRMFDGKELVRDLTIDFQDLLKAESAEEDRFEMLKGDIVLDVSKTIQYINKKFYNK